MVSQAAILLAAASVGILHMSAPDHWATLIALGQTSRWSRTRLIEVGLMTGVGHVALSVVLGFAVLGVGLVFSERISVYVTQAIGLAMLVGGSFYCLRALRAKGVEDTEKGDPEELSEGASRFGTRFRYFAVLGAALSPDLAILPVFLLALPAGWGLAIETAAVFGLASVSALLAFLVLGLAGLARVFERVPPKYNDSLVGFVIAAVGAYVLLFG